VVAYLARRTVSAWGFILFLSCGLIPGVARGDILFTASGNSNDGAISATANFHLTAGTLTLTLTNTETLMASQGQALSQITFQVSPPMSPTLGSTVLGQLVFIQSNGTITNGQTNPSNTTWQVNSTLNPTTLDVFSGGQPDDMIAANPPYGQLTGGISNFNPYFEGSATFTISDPALGPNTTVSNVVFSFGTGANEHTLVGRQGPSPSVPEPSSFALGFAGLIGLSLTQIRRWVRRYALALA
jgi:hypothetical protein